MKLLAILLAAACTKDPTPWMWSGIPDPYNAACAAANGGSSREALTCISKGRAYLCVSDRGARTVQCAPAAAPAPSPAAPAPSPAEGTGGAP